MRFTIVPYVAILSLLFGFGSCKPRKKSSDLASVTDGNFRFGLATQKANGPVRYNEFRICDMKMKNCINPFVTDYGSYQVRASFYEVNAAAFQKYAQLDVLTASLDAEKKSVEAMIAAKKQELNGSATAVGATDITKSIDRQYQGFVTRNDQESNSVLANSSELERLIKGRDESVANTAAAKATYEQALTNYRESLASKLIELPQFVPSDEPKMEDVDLTIAKVTTGPTTIPKDATANASSSSGSTDIGCRCSSTPTKFWLKDAGKIYNESGASRNKYSTCEEMVEDPKFCLRILEKKPSGELFYNTSKCFCPGVVENGVHMTFPMPQGIASCTDVAAIPSGQCLLTTQKEKFSQAQLNYKQAKAEWDQKRKVYEAKVEEKRSIEAALESTKTKIQNLNREERESEAQFLARKNQLNQAINNSKSNIARLASDLSTQKTSLDTAKAKSDSLKNELSDNELRLLKLNDPNDSSARGHFFNTKFSKGQIALASAKYGMKAYDDDWNDPKWNDANDKTLPKSVNIPMLLTAIAQLNNFKISCLMFKPPFFGNRDFDLKSTAMSAVPWSGEAIKSLRTAEDCLSDAEGDVYFEELISKNKIVSKKLADGIYIRPNMPNLRIKWIDKKFKPVEVPKVEPAATATPSKSTQSASSSSSATPSTTPSSTSPSSSSSSSKPSSSTTTTTTQKSSGTSISSSSTRGGFNLDGEATASSPEAQTETPTEPAKPVEPILLEDEGYVVEAKGTNGSIISLKLNQCSNGICTCSKGDKCENKVKIGVLSEGRLALLDFETGQFFDFRRSSGTPIDQL